MWIQPYSCLAAYRNSNIQPLFELLSHVYACMCAWDFGIDHFPPIFAAL